MSKKSLKEYNDYVLLSRDNQATAKARGFQRNHPSSRECEELAERVFENCTKKNNDDQLIHDSTCDTVSVSTTNKNQIILTSNLKERRLAPPNSNNTNSVKLPAKDGGNIRATYESFGFHNDNMVNEAVNTVLNSDLYQNSTLDLVVVENNRPPRGNYMEKSRQHAENHAEMKSVAYARKTDQKLDSIGISKEACTHCSDGLNEHNNQAEISPGTKGSKTVKNWKKVENDEVDIRFEKKFKSKLSLYSNNVEFSKKQLKGTINDKIDNAFKPGGSVGVISGIAQIVDTVERKNVEPFIDADIAVAKAGVAENILGIGEVAHARASMAEFKTGVGGIVGVGASAFSASAHAEYGLNNSVGANLSVVRVQGNVGPVQAGVGLNFETGASVGVNGVGASFLGMGFNIGPSLQFKTPFFDFSVNLF